MQTYIARETHIEQIQIQIQLQIRIQMCVCSHVLNIKAFLAFAGASRH